MNRVPKIHENKSSEKLFHAIVKTCESSDITHEWWDNFVKFFLDNTWKLKVTPSNKTIRNAFYTKLVLMYVMLLALACLQHLERLLLSSHVI